MGLNLKVIDLAPYFVLNLGVFYGKLFLIKRRGEK